MNEWQNIEVNLLSQDVIKKDLIASPVQNQENAQFLRTLTLKENVLFTKQERNICPGKELNDRIYI